MSHQIIESSYTETKTNMYSIGDGKRIHVVSVVYGFALDNPTKLVPPQQLSKNISELMNDYQMGYDELYNKPQPEYLVFDKVDGVTKAKLLSVEVGGKAKSIAQLPHRIVKLNKLGKYEAFTQPKTDEVLLSYTNAYGSKKYALNPLGTGHFDGEKEFDLPIFEYPNDMVKSPIDKNIAPAGFSALHPTAKQRHKFLGKYSKSQQANLAINPSLPANFGNQFFMMSAKDQWLESLGAGTTYKLDGFTSEEIKGSLPNYKAVLTTEDILDNYARHEGKVDTFAIFPSLNIGILVTKFVFKLNSITLKSKYPVIMVQLMDTDNLVNPKQSEESLKKRLGADREMYGLVEDDLLPESMISDENNLEVEK